MDQRKIIVDDIRYVLISMVTYELRMNMRIKKGSAKVCLLVN